MQYIVKYQLHGGQVPYFIEDGGYLFHIDIDGCETLIGMTLDSNNCYIPDTLIKMSQAEFENFMLNNFPEEDLNFRIEKFYI